MWNNLLKLTVISYIWKRYRHTLIAVPILLLYLWLINLIHHDVIAYAKLQNETSWLGWTFLIKWMFVFLGIAVFVIVHVNGRQINPNADKTPNGSQENVQTTDVFDAVRKKDKLRSKADVILGKKE
ncbi:MAG: hypothetical protein ACRBCI_05300 [Cellvibrionaceae bacterium]